MPKITYDCPPRLYKYLSSDRIDVLERTLVRYSPLGAFNDPFEGWPDVTGITTRVDAEKRLEELAPAHIQEAYQRLSQEQRALFRSEKTFISTIHENLRSNPENFHQLLQEATKPVFADLKRGFDDSIGAFCLSEVPDSILMWSHYGASHTGFVIEFDAHNEFFHDRRSEEDDLGFLRRVLYRDARPSSPLSEMTTSELFLVKSSHWSYEREWRILRSLAEATENRHAEPYPIHLFPLPLETITAIIIGAHMSQQDANRLAQIIINSKQGHIKLKNAIPDESHFLLRIVDWVP